MEHVPPAERTLPALLERQAEAFGDRPYLQVGELRRSSPRCATRSRGSPGRSPRRASRTATASRSWRRTGSRSSTPGSRPRGSARSSSRSTRRRAGRSSQHVLVDSGPRVLAVEPELLAQLDVVEELPPELERIWLLERDGGETHRGLPVEPFPGPASPCRPRRSRRATRPRSSTPRARPARRKASCCPQAQFYWWARSTAAMLGGLDEDDVLYTCLPLFHTNALNTCIQALTHGCRVVVGPRFSASRFWQRLVEADATVTYLLGAMISILAKTPPSPAENAAPRPGRARPGDPGRAARASSASASASSCATASG